jgi:hypothetical protein
MRIFLFYGLKRPNKDSSDNMEYENENLHGTNLFLLKVHDGLHPHEPYFVRTV